jgi:hypothetical protein
MDAPMSVKMTADIPADKLIRLRPNRCLFGLPPAYRLVLTEK